MVRHHTTAYFEEIKTVLDKIDQGAIEIIVNLFLDAYDSENQIFVMGNGGSACTASHFACDINKGVSYYLPKKFKAISLNDSVSLIMAYSNDLSYEDIFVEQMKNYLGPGDIVIGISSSGNSINVLKAIEYANKNKAVTIGLTGFDGGLIAKAVQVSLNVPVKDVQKSEDAHLIIAHLIMQILIERLHRKDLTVLMNKAIFLDRDGVINRRARDGQYIRTWSEFKFLPRVKQAINLLSRTDFKIIVITNQRGIARGDMSEADLSRIHESMLGELEKAGGRIDHIFCCPHDLESNCSCRKPEIGLFLEARDKLDINLEQSYLIGDFATDIEAGSRAGCKETILISPAGSYPAAASSLPVLPTKVFKDVYEAASYIYDVHQKES